MANVIIKSRPWRFGKTRSEQAENLMREGWGPGLSAEQLDKCRYLERKLGIKEGLLSQADIDKVK